MCDVINMLPPILLGVIFVTFRPGSLDDEGTEAVRILERCLKESKCLDMESLCIVAEEKVWSIRLVSNNTASVWKVNDINGFVVCIILIYLHTQ